MDQRTAPQPVSPPSPWLARLHGALTAVLLLGGLALAGLAATGRLHLGQPTPALSKKKETPQQAESVAATPSAGRYRIEAVEGVRRLLTRSGRRGFLGEPRIEEAWAFQFSGGFLECQLETEIDGKPASAGPIPDNWPILLAQDERLRIGPKPEVYREGHILVTKLGPFLGPLLPHLGSLFVNGPAGPLHRLVPLHLEVTQYHPFRIFLSVGPAKDGDRGRFNLWNEQMIFLREPLVRDPSREASYFGGGADLSAGREFLLMERQMGYSKLRLKARFLGDTEVTTLMKK